MAIGFAWFSPILFGNTWLSLVGLSEEDAGEGAMPAILGSLIATIVLVVILSIFVDLASSRQPLDRSIDRVSLLAWVCRNDQRREFLILPATSQALAD